jgi:N-acyl amino acid synthase FeeM
VNFINLKYSPGEARRIANANPLDQVDYRLAVVAAEKDAIYNLRYRAYLREGAILPSKAERLADRYDDEPNNFTFGVYYQGELFSSIRISVLNREWRRSLSSEMFSDVLHPYLDRGKTIIDPNRFVSDPDKAKIFPELPFVTVRLGYAACEHFNADIYLSNVRPEHRAFYRKVFLLEPLGEPKLFPGLIMPVGLMAGNFREIRDRVFQRFPFMRSSAFERRMLFDRPSKIDSQNVHTHVDGDIQRETAEIIHRTSKWAGGAEKARFWFRSEGIPAFGGRTAEALVRDGRAAEVRAFLDHVALGGYA